MQLTLVSTPEDRAYYPHLKPLVGATSVKILEVQKIVTWTQVLAKTKEQRSHGILSTHRDLLVKLTGDSGAKISDYAGSFFHRDGLDVVFLDPLKQLFTVNYGKFLASRYVSKLIYPEWWMEEPEFSWEIANAGSIEALYHRFVSADLIAIDTETVQQHLAMRCVGYCGVWFNKDGSTTTHTVVLPLDDMFFVVWMRRFNLLSAPKIFQNGRYDHAYFFRYNAPVENYLWDTSQCMHAWLSELPKDLGFQGSFFRRKGRFWKDLATTAQNLEEYYLYNARDCYNTAMCFLAWIKDAPAWAKANYIQKFPVHFTSHMAEMRGVGVDLARLDEQSSKIEGAIEVELGSLRRSIGVPNFNPNSPKQVKELLCVLGCKDIAAVSSDEKHLQKAMFRHPLNRHILNKILEVRGLRKLQSTYLVKEKFYRARLLYKISPDGTDTGRANSGGSHFWCGFNIQNIPAYTDVVKQIAVADDGFAFAEADFRQAESRGTSVLTGDQALLSAIASGRDFHSVNASAFFGIPYEEIYDDAQGKTLNKPLRNISKRVNHGANYMMGAATLVDTMGLVAIFEAARLLKLPSFWSALDIATYLLAQFEKAYPKIRKDHPDYVKLVVKSTGLLTGPTGWTRRCFGDPSKNKLDLNALVAHRAQSLNGMILDKAMIRVLLEIALHPEHSKNFRLLAQIHDSVFYMYRIGHDYIHDLVRDCMTIPVAVEDISGVKRELIVPVDVKRGVWDGKTKQYIPARYWAECGD